MKPLRPTKHNGVSVAAHTRFSDPPAPQTTLNTHKKPFADFSNDIDSNKYDDDYNPNLIPTKTNSNTFDLDEGWDGDDKDNNAALPDKVKEMIAAQFNHDHDSGDDIINPDDNAFTLKKVHTRWLFHFNQMPKRY
jgi:hypothetical protein